MSHRGDMRWTRHVNERPTISDLALNPGKKARLFRILFQHGLCNGTALFLPYDQGLEQREHDESLRLISKLQEILVKHPGYSIAFWERRHGSFGENMIFPS